MTSRRKPGKQTLGFSSFDFPIYKLLHNSSQHFLCVARGKRRGWSGRKERKIITELMENFKKLTSLYIKHIYSIFSLFMKYSYLE